MGYAASQTSGNQLLHYFIPDGSCLTAVRRLHLHEHAFKYVQCRHSIQCDQGHGLAGICRRGDLQFFFGRLLRRRHLFFIEWCSQSDQEYGFFTDTTQSSNGEASGEYWVAYYSTATNTPQQQTSTPQNSAVIGNLHYDAGAMVFISMYVIPAADSPTVPTSDTGWDFRIQVLNTDYSFTQCSIGAGSTALQNCTVDIPISQMIYANGSPASLPTRWDGHSACRDFCHGLLVSRRTGLHLRGGAALRAQPSRLSIDRAACRCRWDPATPARRYRSQNRSQ